MTECKQCRVTEDIAVRATHLCPGAGPRHVSIALCSLHAAPYKTARPLPLEH